MKKYIKLMQENAAKFNKLRESENYKAITISNEHNLKVIECNLKGITFYTCYSGQWKSCDSGQWESCYSGQWKSCDSGQWEFCYSGQWKSCNYGQWKSCYYGSIVICTGKIINSYIKELWNCNIQKEKCVDNDIDAYIKIQKIEINKKNKKLIFYKITNDDSKDYYTGKIHYKNKTTVECPDWDDNYNGQCGNGFHVSPTIEDAKKYNSPGKIKKVLVSPEDIKVYINDLSKVRVKKLYVVGDVKEDK